MADDFESLIQAVASQAPDDDEAEGVQASKPPVFNYPGVVAASWAGFVLIAVLLALFPMPGGGQPASRSIEIRLGVAMYHMAHRIESYNQQQGSLPDYLEADWQESNDVEYRRTETGYVLEGQLGQYSLVYRRGDNAELLLHSRLTGGRQ